MPIMAFDCRGTSASAEGSPPTVIPGGMPCIMAPCIGPMPIPPVRSIDDTPLGVDDIDSANIASAAIYGLCMFGPSGAYPLTGEA